MPILEWGNVFTVQSPYATIPLNDDLGATMGAGWEGRIFRLVGSNCRANRGIRLTKDPIPQGDGDVHHDRFSEGYWMQLEIALWDGDHIACDAALVEMGDLLAGVFWSLLRPEGDGGRIFWTPSGEGERLLDAVRLASFSDPEEGDEGVTVMRAVLDSRFPYAISHFQDVVTLNGIGGSVTNGGNVDFWPVLKVYADGATITNVSTGKTIELSSGCLGGGSYIEIDSFRMTAYVDGDQSNAKPCVDPLVTEFFPITPGANEIDTTTTVEVLMNDAWA